MADGPNPDPDPSKRGKGLALAAGVAALSLATAVFGAGRNKKNAAEAAAEVFAAQGQGKPVPALITSPDTGQAQNLQAANLDEVQGPKRPEVIVHVVKSGDSLSEIALRYLGNGNLAQRLADYNDIEDANSIRIGQKIKIPPQEAAAPADRQVEAPPVRSAVEPAPAKTPARGTTYRVKSGDVLSKIVERECGSVKLLSRVIEYNRQKDPNFNPNRIFIGQTIHLPPVGTQAQRSTPKSGLEPLPAGQKWYTIKSGDILENIARKQLGGRRFLQDILDLNEGMSKKSILRPGKSIIIPDISEQRIAIRKAGLPDIGPAVQRRNPTDAELAALALQFTAQPQGSPSSANRIGVPIDKRSDRLAGNSRGWGDASAAVKVACMREVLNAFRDRPIEEQAAAMAICMHESGFNPDAATTTSTAAGLFQFLSDTGRERGLPNSAATFDARRNALAARRLFVEKHLNQCGGAEGYELCLALYDSHHTTPMARVNAENSPFMGPVYSAMLKHLTPSRR